MEPETCLLVTMIVLSTLIAFVALFGSGQNIDYQKILSNYFEQRGYTLIDLKVPGIFEFNGPFGVEPRYFKLLRPLSKMVVRKVVISNKESVQKAVWVKIYFPFQKEIKIETIPNI